MKPPSHSEPPAAPPLVVEPGAEAAYPRPTYAWYVVGVLTLAYMFSFLDRQIIVFMVDPLKRDFGLTNAQIGLLHGTSFALFYTLFGLPVGRWADTHSRRGLIAVGFVLWSLMTAASGLAQKFWHLLLCRVGVGVGEATLSPAAYSLIADYFPPQRRATAIGVYSFGVYLGSGLSLVCLGLLMGFLGSAESPVLPLVGAVRPWQALFLIVGLPGVLCALLLATVREVPRGGVRNPASGVAGVHAMTLGEVFTFLWTHRGTFLSLFLGMACLTFAGYANSTWVIKLFAIRHGWSGADAGVVVGLIVALGGAVGAVGGGRLADFWRSRGRADANLRVALLGAVAMTIAGVCYPLAGSGAWAAAWLTPMVIGFSAPFGVVAAAIQQLAPGPMRAQASALFLFVVNLLGMGLGPLATGWLTDWLSPDGKSLHLALATALTAGSLAAVGFFAFGFKPYRKTNESLAATAAVPA
ncbi:MAG: MFS transporter [Verrucomicrobia bacterium]|nr:MFS transporter [Verrucomicrobiota bacterium]